MESKEMLDRLMDLGFTLTKIENSETGGFSRTTNFEERRGVLGVCFESAGPITWISLANISDCSAQYYVAEEKLVEIDEILQIKYVFERSRPGFCPTQANLFEMVVSGRFDFRFIAFNDGEKQLIRSIEWVKWQKSRIFAHVKGDGFETTISIDSEKLNVGEDVVLRKEALVVETNGNKVTVCPTEMGFEMPEKVLRRLREVPQNFSVRHLNMMAKPETRVFYSMPKNRSFYPWDRGLTTQPFIEDISVIESVMRMNGRVLVKLRIILEDGPLILFFEASLTCGVIDDSENELLIFSGPEYGDHLEISYQKE